MSSSVTSPPPAYVPLPREVDTITPIAEALDRVSHEERLEWMYRVPGNQLEHLFELARGHAPVHARDLATPVGEPIVCHGQNALFAFRRFAKVFARVDDRIVGYNLTAAFQTTFVGCGHFVAYDSPDVSGEVWIDYRELPEETHADFPPLRSNNRGLARLVYGGMYDVLRRISRHLLIGNSVRDLPGNAAFAICRPEDAPLPEIA